MDKYKVLCYFLEYEYARKHVLKHKIWKNNKFHYPIQIKDRVIVVVFDSFTKKKKLHHIMTATYKKFKPYICIGNIAPSALLKCSLNDKLNYLAVYISFNT